MRLSAITAVLIGSGVMIGCASNKPFAGIQVVPQASTHHGVKTAAGHYALGRYFHGSARLADAEKAYGEALRLQPAYKDALAALGMVRSEQGRHVEAVSLLRSAANLAPRSASVLNNLGYALMSSGEPEKAVLELDRALAAAPGNARILNNLKLAQEAVRKADSNVPRGKVHVLTESKSAPDASARAVPLQLTNGSVPDSDPQESGFTQTVSTTKPVDVKPISTELQTNVVKLAPAIYSVEYGVPAAGDVAVAARVDGWAQVAEATTLSAPSPAITVTPITPKNVSKSTKASLLVATGTGKGHICESVGVKTENKVRLEVQNGNGKTGMARAVGYQLASPDLKLVRLTNRMPFDVPRTVVEFSKGKLSEACAIAKRFSLGAPRETQDLSPNVDVRLVLGKDASQAVALAQNDQNFMAGSGFEKFR